MGWPVTDAEWLAAAKAYFSFVENPATGEMGCMTMGRFGVMTSYWLQRPAGQGAALSIGTATDRYAVYAEIEAQRPVSCDQTAISARCDALNLDHVNRAIDAQAHNSGVANVAIRVEATGIEVAQAVTAFFIGKALATMKQLWP